MEQERNNHEIAVTWRGKKFVVDMNLGATLEELGQELQKLTDVKADTMKLIVQSHKASKLLSPFSNEQSHLTLQETCVIEAKSIRMMGVPKEEIDQILQNAQKDLRIAGFEEEEKRMRQRMSNGPQTSLKLPQGNYIFCDFKTLSLPGIELNPPASEALRLMHTLAADPGIVAIMNKHRWRVGIMSEMAPEGYVGVSPVCILGLNKNKGEEISLRLRTDDLKGFRKYQSIKKTLLHELAHMVFSEHDAKFYALDKQLNQEANTLDWTRSTGHTLSGAEQYHEQEFHVSHGSSRLSHKLGGNPSDRLATARAASVTAAYQRLVIESSNTSRTSIEHREPDPDASEDIIIDQPESRNSEKGQIKGNSQPDPDDWEGHHNKFEPDPDDSISGGVMESEPYREFNGSIITSEPDPDEPEVVQDYHEPDPDDSQTEGKILSEPDPDDSMLDDIKIQNIQDPDDSQAKRIMLTKAEPDPDDSMLDDEELQRIQDPVMVACSRLKKYIEMLQSEVGPAEAATVVQTLFKIVRNVIEHPGETKFRKLRKANPVIQRNIASYKAAMEILFLIGFCEDIVEDEIGRAEAYLVLKRNDPGLLWLAKSSLETCIAF